MEEVQLLVQEEGRAAKHAAFSVPVEPPQALSAPQPEMEQSKQSNSTDSTYGLKEENRGCVVCHSFLITLCVRVW